MTTEPAKTITWTNTAGLITVAPVVDGEAVLHTVHGLYYAPVSIKATGRTLTRTPAGKLGTKCAILFVAEGVTVHGWVA